MGLLSERLNIYDLQKEQELAGNICLCFWDQETGYALDYVFLQPLWGITNGTRTTKPKANSTQSCRHGYDLLGPDLSWHT